MSKKWWEKYGANVVLFAFFGMFILILIYDVRYE